MSGEDSRKDAKTRRGAKKGKKLRSKDAENMRGRSLTQRRCKDSRKDPIKTHAKTQRRCKASRKGAKTQRDAKKTKR